MATDPITQKILDNLKEAMKPAVPWLIAGGAVLAMVGMGWSLLKKEAKRHG